MFRTIWKVPGALAVCVIEWSTRQRGSPHDLLLLPRARRRSRLGFYSPRSYALTCSPHEFMAGSAAGAPSWQRLKPRKAMGESHGDDQ
jgi:hypothetical protein